MKIDARLGTKETNKGVDMITKLKIGVFYLRLRGAGALPLAVPLTAQPDRAPERFTALAVNLESARRAMTGTVEIDVKQIL